MNASAATDAAARWRDARRVLVVRLDNLGDVLMSSPACAAIAAHAPDMALTLLASPAGAAAAAHLPMIDGAIEFRAPWMKGDGGPCDDARRLIDELAARRFDAAIVFTVCTQSALPAAQLLQMAGIPLRLAYCRENPYALLSDWRPETDLRLVDGMRHEVQRHLDLVAAVGYGAPAATGLRFGLRARDAHAMRAKFAAAGGDPGRPYLLVHPGVSAASRRYPAERFGRAAAALAAASGCQIVFSGAAEEQPLVDQARSSMPAAAEAVSLAGRLDLGELAALIAGAEALICNNSGPAHIAAAVGTPVVVLYALTNPQHRPWQATARVLSHPVPCAPCLKSHCPEGHHACLTGVPPEAIVAATLELMRMPRGVPLARPAWA